MQQAGHGGGPAGRSGLAACQCLPCPRARASSGPPTPPLPRPLDRPRSATTWSGTPTTSSCTSTSHKRSGALQAQGHQARSHQTPLLRRCGHGGAAAPRRRPARLPLPTHPLSVFPFMPPCTTNRCLVLEHHLLVNRERLSRGSEAGSEWHSTSTGGADDQVIPHAPPPCRSLRAP